MTKQLKQVNDSVLFVKRARFYNYSTDKMTNKSLNDPNHRLLFLLSNICVQDFFENMPKTFTISTKKSILRFNIQMLKETSPVISKFIKENPNEKNYNIKITDGDNILTKFEQLYQGKCIIFNEDEFPLIQRFTQKFQIKNCPNCLKPKNLTIREIDSDGYKITSSNEQQIEVCLYQKYFIQFLKRDEYKVFKIKTNEKEYDCNIFAVYTSNVIRQILNKDPTVTEYVYNFDDKNDEFQIICDFFNYKQIDLKSSNIELIETIAKDLQIDCIIKTIENYNNVEKENKRIIEKHKNVIDSIGELFDILYNIDKYGIEKVKNSIMHSKWSKKEEDVEELAAFILQVVKPSFSLQKEMADLLVELNKEASEDNQLKLLIPLIVEKLMKLYWPQNCLQNKFYLTNDDTDNILNEVDSVNLNNRCVYSFIRLLYKRGIIPKEEIIKKLENYSLYNNTFNAYFLPELAEIDPHNFYLISIIENKQDRMFMNEFHSFISSIFINTIGHCFYLPKIARKYFPDKIELYERMLDNMEPDDEITKSIREDDVDKLQQIIIKEQIDISEFKVSYNIFDDLEEDQSLINYSALYGSVKCFKYLKLNNSEIDENTFYFSIIGSNNEIIKIVEQRISKDDKKETNEQNQRYYDTSTRYFNCYSFYLINSFWIPMKKRIKKRNFYMYSNNNMDCASDKYNDDNIEYQRRKKTNNNISIFLNCLNINNQVAPTIAFHKNELFEWSFQKIFVSNFKYGKALKYLADISIINGNIHSFIKLLENGFHVTKHVISLAAKNGFYSLTKLLLDLYDEEVKPEDYNESFDYKSTVMFGNLSIFKLFIDRLNQFDLTKAILYAIKKNYTSIIKYVFDNVNKFSFIKLNNKFLEKALKFSLNTKTTELFDFLIEQFKKLNPNQITDVLYCDLLNQSYSASNLPVIKIITDLILKEHPLNDFTAAFFSAASLKSTEICQYFLDKGVSIDFTNSMYILELGGIDIELFERIIKEVNPNYKFLFYESIYRAIQSRNVKVIEFILKDNRPINLELFEAVRTDDVEIVELILKYNSDASFINQKEHQGTALSIAIDQKNHKIVKRLLSIPGIDPTIMNYQRQDALCIAAKKYDIEIFDTILNFYNDNLQLSAGILTRASAFLSIRCYEGSFISDLDWYKIKRFSSLKNFDVNNLYNSQPFLYIACFYNKIDAAEFLLQNENIDPNLYECNAYNTPLMICLEKKYTKLAELLIKHPKTNINLRNVNDESALIIAIKNEEEEIVDILLKDERFDAKESRLNLGFIYSKEEMSQRLYSSPNLDVNEEFVDAHSTAKSKINALIHAVKINDISKIDKIVEHRTFNIYKSRISNAIFISVQHNNINVFRKLMTLINNDYTFVDNKHQTLLRHAAKYLSCDIIDEILKNQLFDSKSDHFLYAFTRSYSKSHKKQKKRNEHLNDILSFGLYSNNVSRLTRIWQTNQEVLNPDTIPNKSSVVEVMKQFLEYDKEHQRAIKFEELLPNGKSFITIMASDYSSIGEVSEFLLSSGVDPNKADKFNVYPLEHAIKMNSIELVKSLVNSERIEYSQMKEGVTYLHLAASNKDPTILSFLLEKNIIDVNSVDALGETPLIRACRAKLIDNINLLFKKDNLDYLHRNNNGKDALGILDQLPQDDLEPITQNREKYHNKLISIIEEKLSSIE